jgi:DNA-binding transcriptional MerR regulator
MAENEHGREETGEKDLFRIGEVCRLTQTKPFVLRYWETEFPSLQPVKSPSGHRLYRRQDIDTVLEIKRLLYEQGFTIAGARRHLQELQSNGDEPRAEGTTAAANAPAKASPGASRAVRVKLLLDLREELQAILTLLESE